MCVWGTPNEIRDIPTCEVFYSVWGTPIAFAKTVLPGIWGKCVAALPPIRFAFFKNFSFCQTPLGGDFLPEPL